MADSSDTILEELNLLALSLHAQLDQAEARVSSINVLINQLAGLDGATETAILGLVIYEGHYSVFTGPHESGPVLQSALLIPGGIGVVYWASEEYAAIRKNPPKHEKDLLLRFFPFDNCPSAIKSLLLPQVQPLMEQLFSRFTFLRKNDG